MAIAFACGNCGKAYRIDERFAGKKVACRACGKINVVPGAPQGPLAREGIIALPPQEDTLELSEVASEVPSGGGALDLAPDDREDTIAEVQIVPRNVEGPPPVARSLAQQAMAAGECPNCGTPIARGSVICTGCGLNFNTGKQIATETVVRAGGDDEGDDEGMEGMGSAPGAFGKPAMYLVMGGLVSALLSIISPWFALVGVAMALTGALLYAVDGANKHAAFGGGATIFALVLFFISRPSEPPAPPPAPAPVAVAPAPPPPPPIAVTQPAPEPLPEVATVTKVSPGVFRHNNPGKDQDPVAFWSPLRNDGDPEVRLFVIQQLSRVAEPFRPAARDVIAEMAGDADVRVRRSALLSATPVKSPKAVEAVNRALNDADDEVVLTAIRAAGRFQDASSIDALVGKQDKFGEEVLDALGRFGPESAERVTRAYQQMLASGAPAVRVRLMGVLVEKDPEGAAALLAPLMADGSAEIRAEAMSRLADLKNAAALTAILDRLTEDPENVTKAVKKFGQTAEAPVLARLVDAQTDGQRKVALLGLLKEVGTTQSLRPVKTLAQDPEMAVALAAREVWRKLAPGEFTELDEALLDIDSERPEFVARALGLLAGISPDDEHRARVLRKVYAIVAKGDGELAVKGIPALVTWADRSFKESLFGTIRPDPKVPNPMSDPGRRLTAMRVAGATKEPSALLPLIVCLESNTESGAAVEAIRQYGTVAEEHVIRLLFRGKPEVQGPCCELLKAIGTSRCQPALLRMVWLSKDLSAKQMAKETLDVVRERLAAEEDKAANTEKVGGR